MMSVDGIKAVRGSNLRERDSFIGQMIDELKAKNEGLKDNLQHKLYGEEKTSEEFEEEVAQEKVETLGDEKKKLERELRAVENRIKHILAEHEEIESEMAGYESKAKRILEARSKKIEWERQKERELQLAEEMARKKREELAKKAEERDQLISQRREINSRQQEQAQQDVKAEKKVAEALREKISEYEKVVKEHKKLMSLNIVHPSKVDQLHRIKTEKRQKKDYLVSKAKLESQAVSELDKKLEKLRQVEQRMLEEKKVSLTQKGLLKSHLQDIMNKKIQENEISELLMSRDRQVKSPGGIRRKSLTRILQGEDIDKEPRTKSPGLPTKFVGGNIGSYTEMRKQTWEQREKGAVTLNEISNNHSQIIERPSRTRPSQRFASPQAKLTQTRPATAAAINKGPGIASPKGPVSFNRLEVLNGKDSNQPKLTKPAVSKPAIVTVAKPTASKVAQKKETQKQVLATTAQKTIMRGKGTKKDLSDMPNTQPQTDRNSADLIQDADVQIESSRHEGKEEIADSRLSETQFGSSTIELSKPADDSKDGHQFQFEGSTL